MADVAAARDESEKRPARCRCPTFAYLRTDGIVGGNDASGHDFSASSPTELSATRCCFAVS
jgi:hypothetical protein